MTEISKHHRIDTHHHAVPDFYRDWLLDKGLTAGGRAIPTWSPSSALSLMEGTDVELAVLSVSTPGVEPAFAELIPGRNDCARQMARRLNEHSAEIAESYPGRFSFFATLPMPDVEGAIEEATYATETLGASGVILLANTGGIYLGDPRFDELLYELNERSATIFVHPSHLPVDPVPGLAPFIADFLLDTTRAAANLVRTGAIERYDDLKIILSHAGGFVPYAAGRMASHVSSEGDREHGLALLKRFYFDTALSSTRYALLSLLEFAGPDHVLYGSDFPYAPSDRSTWFTRELDRFKNKQDEAINRENALNLMPHLRQVLSFRPKVPSL